jgi:hypothetical protein
MNEEQIPIKATIEVILRDKEGKIKDCRKCESDLLVRGFFRYFYNFFCRQGWAIQDEDGGTRGLDRGQALDYHGWIFKIAIGESDRAPSASDYRLDLKVSETSQLGITSLAEIGNKAEFDVTAKLTVPVERDIGEIGIFGWHRVSSWESQPYMLARDIFSPKIHMTTSDILDIRYRFTLGIA